MENQKLKHLTVDFQRGSILFREGEESNSLYILLSGSLEVLKNQEQVSMVKEPGSFVGEMSTLLEQPRSATVKVNESSRIVVIPALEVESFLQTVPNIAMKLVKQLATRLDATTKKLAQSKSGS